MPAPRTSRRARLAAATSAALAFTGLQLFAAPAADAVSAGLVIREVFGGGGNVNAKFNADFVELYNPTDSAIPLSGLGLQFRTPAGAVGNNNVVSLSGTVPAGKPFLVQMSDAGAVGDPLPPPDQVASPPINLSNTNGQVLLLPSTTAFTETGDLAGNPGVIDMVGYGPGTDPNLNNSFETAPTAILSNGKSAARTAPFTDTDDNSADFTTGAPTPENSGFLAATDLGDKTGQVGTAITPFQLAATGGTGPYQWAATGLPDGIVVAADGTVSGTPTTAGGYTVTATVTDSATPAPATDAVEFVIQVAKGTSSVSAADVSVEYGVAATVKVDVGAPAGVVPAGTVTVRHGSTTVGTATLSGGVATVTLPAKSLPAGTATLTATYSGDGNLSAGSDALTAHVAKAASTTTAKVKPNKPQAGHKAKLTVTVSGDHGVVATGQVKITVDGHTVTKTLEAGGLKLKLKKLGKGKHKVKVVYLGSANVATSSTTLKFKAS